MVSYVHNDSVYAKIAHLRYRLGKGHIPTSNSTMTLKPKGAIWGRAIYLFWKNKVRLLKNWISQFLFFSKKITKNDLEWLRNNKTLQKLIYYIFCLHSFLIFMFLIFRIIFGRTCYGTMVLSSIIEMVKSIEAKVEVRVEMWPFPTL